MVKHRPSLHRAQVCLLILAMLAIIDSFTGCKKNKTQEATSTQSVPTAAEIKYVSFSGHNNLMFQANLVIPQGVGPYPVVIVLHGCGGLYGDPANHTMESHFIDWIDIFQKHKIVALFVDSYHYPRGFDSFCSKAPPDDAVCSPAYERPRDVPDAITYLSTLPYVDKKRIGLLGFSQGAETAISAALNTTAITKSTWTVKSNGSTYEVSAPAVMPVGAKIKAVVAYYPGLGYYNYYGSVSNSSDGAYLPVAPVLIHAATLDPLYTSGAYDVFAARTVRSGASTLTNNQVEFINHDGAAHSFDGASSGADGTANSAAKTQTLQWFVDRL